MFRFATFYLLSFLYLTHVGQAFMRLTLSVCQSVRPVPDFSNISETGKEINWNLKICTKGDNATLYAKLHNTDLYFNVIMPLFHLEDCHKIFIFS